MNVDTWLRMSAKIVYYNRYYVEYVLYTTFVVECRKYTSRFFSGNQLILLDTTAQPNQWDYAVVNISSWRIYPSDLQRNNHPAPNHASGSKNIRIDSTEFLASNTAATKNITII